MSGATRRVTILCADDDPDIRAVVAAFLEHLLGCEVRLAKDGTEALQLARAMRPDVALIDVRMPGLDGWEVCKRLKSDEETRTIKVVLMTALEPKESDGVAATIGADGFISKPFQGSKLLELLEGLIIEPRSRRNG